MPKGGYRVINLNGAILSTTTAANVAGIYSTIEGTNGKPLLFTNFEVDGVDQNSAWITLRNVGSTYQGIWVGQADGRNYVMRVFQDDNVLLVFTPSIQSAGDEPASGEDGPSASM